MFEVARRRLFGLRLVQEHHSFSQVHLFIFSYFLATRLPYMQQDERNVFFFQSSKPASEEGVAKRWRPALGGSLFLPHRVSPRCDVTEWWRLSRFTVREKSPVHPSSTSSPLPLLLFFADFSLKIPSLRGLELPVLLLLATSGTSPSAT